MCFRPGGFFEQEDPRIKKKREKCKKKIVKSVTYGFVGLNKNWIKNRIPIFFGFGSLTSSKLYMVDFNDNFEDLTYTILNVPKFTANLYCICLSMPKIYT